MNQQPDNPRVVIMLHLTPAPGNWQAPADRRLARLLKAMKRGYGWRCVACRPVAPADAGQAPTEGRP